MNTKFDFADLSKQLLQEQKIEWEQCKEGYDSLEFIREKKFLFDGFSIKVQFNAGRMLSTSAKVDDKSIKERKCFLCIENLPLKQRSIQYSADNYLILCNPFPIFPEHFTIPSAIHQPQKIKTSINVLLDLSKDLSKHYTIFYNGPRCGASAPDHLHFQAGTKNFMTIENDLIEIKKKYSQKIFSGSDLIFYSVDDNLRKFFLIESSNSEKIIKSFNIFYETYSTDEEAMLNIISTFENNIWRVIIFLREKHRPSFYFEEGEKQILLSPASVDIGGVCITPREEDFNKIDNEIITKIFKEIFINKEKFYSLISKIKSKLEKSK